MDPGDVDGWQSDFDISIHDPTLPQNCKGHLRCPSGTFAVQRFGAKDHSNWTENRVRAAFKQMRIDASSASSLAFEAAHHSLVLLLRTQHIAPHDLTEHRFGTRGDEVWRNSTYSLPPGTPSCTAPARHDLIQTRIASNSGRVLFERWQAFSRSSGNIVSPPSPGLRMPGFWQDWCQLKSAPSRAMSFR